MVIYDSDILFRNWSPVCPPIWKGRMTRRLLVDGRVLSANVVSWSVKRDCFEKIVALRKCVLSKVVQIVVSIPTSSHSPRLVDFEILSSYQRRFYFYFCDYFGNYVSRRKVVGKEVSQFLVSFPRSPRSRRSDDFVIPFTVQARFRYNYDDYFGNYAA